MSNNASHESTARTLPLLRFLAPGVGLLTGYLAMQLEGRFAAVGLFPLLVGVATGLGVTALMRLAGSVRLRPHFVGATLAALAAVGTMHYLSYVEAKRRSEAQFDKYEQMVHAFPQPGVLNNIPKPITGFGDFVRQDWQIGRPLGPISIRGSWLALWWAIDALLVWLGATVTAVRLCERRLPKETKNAENPPANAGGSPGETS